MKIYFFVNSRMPSEKAEGIETAKLSEALARKAEVVLLYPARYNYIKDEVYDYYSVVRNFSIQKIPVLDLNFIFPSRIFFYLEVLSYALFSLAYSLFKVSNDDIIFTHDTYLAFIFSIFRKNVVFDMHDFPRAHRGLHRWFLRRLRGITTTNRWKKNELIKSFGVDESKIISQPNGVDADKFLVNKSRPELRRELNLPEESTIIGYVGMLRTMGMKKGIDTLLYALKQLPDNVTALLVGGNKEDVKYYAKMAEDLGLKNRVRLAGWVKHSDIPKYLSASDILVAPFPKNEHYDHYMCPMKVIEYMASGRPMVVSDLESIREIVNDEMAYFFKPDDVDGLAGSISEIIKSMDISKKKAAMALEKSRMFSWDERATKIINFISALKIR